MNWSMAELAFGFGIVAFFLLRSLINRRFNRLEKIIRSKQPVDDDQVKDD
jgi:TRAP-type C4-dicarboxylate transport system permease small subunit